MRDPKASPTGTPVIVDMELVVDRTGKQVDLDGIVEKFRAAGFAIRP